MEKYGYYVNYSKTKSFNKDYKNIKRVSYFNYLGILNSNKWEILSISKAYEDMKSGID